MLQVYPQYLRYGEEGDRKVAQQHKLWDNAISLQEREVFEAFLALSAPNKRIIRETILAFARAYSSGPGKYDR